MIAITDAEIYTVSEKGHLEDATLLVEDGKVKEVGTEVEIPDDAEVISAEGKVVTPGFVEAHCHLSIFSLDEEAMNGPGNGGKLGPARTPQYDYYWAFNPYSEQLKPAHASGVTTMLTGPGSGKVITGQNLVAKSYGKSRQDMVMKSPAGVKMAFGENPKRNFGSRKQMPATRMAVAAMLREALIEAENYRKKRQKAEENGKPVPTDLEMEPLVKLLEGEIPARIHAHRADDIMTVIRIAEEFGIEHTLEHSTETHKIIDEIAARDLACVVGPTYGTSTKVETAGKTFETPAALEEAGISRIAITTDAPVVSIEHLRTSACLAHAAGMSFDGALRAITLEAAEIAGVEERVGSLEPGKDADFVILDGSPLEITTAVKKVFLEGEEIFDSEKAKEPWEELKR